MLIGLCLELVKCFLRPSKYTQPNAALGLELLCRLTIYVCCGLRSFLAAFVPQVFEALVPAVLEQKVVGKEAWRAWRYLLRRYGEAAPGPVGLRVPPPPEVWVRIPSWEWHRSGIEAVRARTIIGAARVASRLEIDDTAEADRR